MYKFTTIYRRVDDENAIDTFFSEIHLPLAEKLPNLCKSEVSRVVGKPGGESRFYMMYELYFESAESFKTAMITETGLALMTALKPWGDARLVTWFYSESFEDVSDEGSA